MRALLFAMALAGCCEQRWRDTLAVYDAVTVTCDVGETLQFSDLGRWDLAMNFQTTPVTEGNPVLGEHPSVATLLGWFGASLGAIYLVHRSHTHGATFVLAALGMIETTVNIHNLQLASPCGLVKSPLVRENK